MVMPSSSVPPDRSGWPTRTACELDQRLAEVPLPDGLLCRLKRAVEAVPGKSELILQTGDLQHKEIARGLGIRPNTARRHSEHVLRKLKITSRSDVAEVLGLPSGLQIPEHGTDLNE